MYDQNIEDIKASLQRIEDALAYLTGKPLDAVSKETFEPTLGGAIEAAKKGGFVEYITK